MMKLSSLNIKVKGGSRLADVHRLDIECDGQRFVITPARRGDGGIVVSAFDTLEIHPDASNRVTLKDVDR